MADALVLLLELGRAIVGIGSLAKPITTDVKEKAVKLDKAVKNPVVLHNPAPASASATASASTDPALAPASAPASASASAPAPAPAPAPASASSVIEPVKVVKAVNGKNGKKANAVKAVNAVSAVSAVNGLTSSTHTPSEPQSSVSSVSSSSSTPTPIPTNVNTVNAVSAVNTVSAVSAVNAPTLSDDNMTKIKSVIEKVKQLPASNANSNANANSSANIHEIKQEIKDILENTQVKKIIEHTNSKNASNVPKIFEEYDTIIKDLSTEENEQKKENEPIIDIGGEIFNLNRSSTPIELYYKDRKQFDDIFLNENFVKKIRFYKSDHKANKVNKKADKDDESKYDTKDDVKDDKTDDKTDDKRNRIYTLLKTYLPLQFNRTFNFATNDDYEDLIIILEARKTDLLTLCRLNSTAIINMIYCSYYKNLIQLIDNITTTYTTGFIENKKEFDKLSIHDKIEKLLAISWYLFKYDGTPIDLRKEWSTLLQDINKIHVKDLINLINKQSIPDNITQMNLNIFKSGNNVADLESYKEQIKTNIKKLLTIITLDKHFNSPQKSDNDDNDDNDGIDEKMKGGRINSRNNYSINKSLHKAVVSLTKHINQLYNPISKYTYNSTKQSMLNLNINVSELLKILHINTIILDKPNNSGIYKITNINKKLLMFIKRQLNAMFDEVNKKRNIRDKLLFIQQLMQLPEIRLPSMKPHIENTVLSNQRSYLQFLVVNNNMYIPTDLDTIENLHKNTHAKIIDELENFFNDDCLYILCTSDNGSVECDAKSDAKSDAISDAKSDDTCGVLLPDVPIKLKEIDFNDVTLNNDTIFINELPTNYFNKQNKEKKSELLFNTIIQPTITKYYNNSTFAMSIFHILNNTFSK